MTKLNLQFALAAMLMAVGVGICVDYFRVESELAQTRTELLERRARLAAFPELLSLPGSATADTETNDGLRDAARLGQAQIVEEESAIEQAVSEARSRVALGRLALVTGTGVLVVAWLNFRRRFTTAAAQA